PSRYVDRRYVQRGRGLLAPAPGLLAAELIGGPADRRLDQPTARIGRHTVLGPVRGGREQRLLHGILGHAEIADPCYDHAEDLRRERAQQVIDAWPFAHTSVPVIDPITSRTVIGCCSGTPPGAGTAETLAAISMARSRDSTSTIWNPASSSLYSA